MFVRRFQTRRTAAWTTLLLSLLTIRFVLAPVGAAEAASEKIRALVITGGHDYEKKPFVAMFEAMPDIQAKHVSYPEAADLLKPDLKSSADVIVFYDMWNKGFSPEQKKAFLELLNQGIGVVALHHTLGAHGDWPEYEKIIGGRFHIRERVVDGKKLPTSGFDHDQDMSVTIADSEHPITRGMQDFQIHDETYCRYETDPSAKVLLTTKHPKSDPELAWVKTYGRSRVFFLQLGHDHFAYENPNYRTLVARGIRWAAESPVKTTP